MLVVWSSRIVGRASIYQVQKNGKKNNENFLEIYTKKEFADKVGLKKKASRVSCK